MIIETNWAKCDPAPAEILIPHDATRLVIDQLDEDEKSVEKMLGRFYNAFRTLFADERCTKNALHGIAIHICKNLACNIEQSVEETFDKVYTFKEMKPYHGALQFTVSYQYCEESNLMTLTAERIY